MHCLPSDRPIAAPSARARTAPPLQRGSMTPAPWFGFWRGLLFALWPGLRFNGAARFDCAWHGAARARRRVLLLLVAAMVGAALVLRIDTSPPDLDAWWWASTALMTLLFAWVGVGCATAVMGAWALWRGDPYAPRLSGARMPIRSDVRTALVMPICNEDIAEVFAGLRATCESLAATGQAQRFDVFVLSDTKEPALQQAEQLAFERLRSMLDGAGVALFYRWRKRRTKRKAGNVADFCRRWGRNYRYMIVLDADSTMSGDTLVDLVRLMEQHPRAGIIQTLPQVANPTTLHARAQHFAGRVTGRLFALGMAWWQLGDAHYWGHNAILRIEPFMRHCALAKLPGRGGLAGEILSHDFVEAALMGRRGYEVWLVPDLGGSWEQSPSNLLDELQRDRRWCQGNLQNLRLVAEPGWRPAHRMMFSVGALSYLVAPLWLLFIVLGLGLGGGLLAHDLSLWLLTLALLIVPRALGVLVIALRGEAAAFGGVARLSLGAVIELLMSTIQAPIRMLAHCMFVLGALTGLKLEWKSPPRGGEAVSWRDASRRMGSLTMLPLAASLGLLRLHAAFIAMVPMLLPLSLAVPFTVVTGHPRAGRAVARLGLLRTPEEWRPTRVLVRATERQSFLDLVPRPPQPALVHAWVRPRRALRLVSASLMMGVAALAMTVPQSGIAPELPAALRAESDRALAWRAEQEVVAYWTEPMLPLVGQAPVRKRVVARNEKPARMIDDALRERALEAVRMLMTQPPPV